MSIAVRVSVWILGVLVAVSAAVAVLALMQKQTLQGQNQKLHSQIMDDQSKLFDLTSRAKKLEDQASQLSSKVTQAQQDKAQVQSQYDDLKRKSDDLQAQLTQANSDRNDWKNRVDTVSHERDALAEKLKNPPVKIVYKDRVVVKPDLALADEGMPSASANVSVGQGDQYWAAVLKQKAALQLQVEKEKADLDQAALQVIDLKKQNSDLELEVKQVSNDKDEIVQRIKYGQDLADSLAIDLARSRNDQKAIDDRADRLKQENLQLLSQIRGLTATKLDLERTIARLTDDKDAMQKKLVETESIIQNRIDDIWKIKDSLDRKLSQNVSSASNVSSSSGSMELPPIIVNPTDSQQQAAVNNPPAPSTGRTEGSIISINESNNFVIVDLGQENSPVSIGNSLKVYRSSTEIATLEVIQVRRQICAADIKNKVSELQVGDVVKFN